MQRIVLQGWRRPHKPKPRRLNRQLGFALTLVPIREIRWTVLNGSARSATNPKSEINREDINEPAGGLPA